MNKKSSKNGTHQQNKKKIPKNTSQHKTGLKRSIQHHEIKSSDSGINFLINVSSSGTNLNEKIEQGMSRLSQVEQKIRNHKCKATAITSSAKSPLSAGQNQRQLKQILENMLRSMDLSYERKKVIAVEQKKGFGSSSSKTMGKETRSIPNTVVLGSLTEVTKSKRKQQIPKNVKAKSRAPQKERNNNKSVLKTPSTAPVSHGKSTTRVSKLAEKLDAEKTQVPLTTIQTKKTSASDLLVKTLKDKGAAIPENVEVVIEKTSLNNVSYVYDSTSLKVLNDMSLKPDPLIPSDGLKELFFPEKKNPYSSEESSESTVFLEEKSTELVEGDKLDQAKPKRKKVYSYLKKGNLTLAHQLETTANTTTIDQTAGEELTSSESSMRDVAPLQQKNQSIEEIPSVNPSKEPSYSNAQTVTVSSEKIKHVLSSGVQSDLFDFPCYSDITMFPTELLEKSILAVENVLRTIDSMTNEFDLQTETKDPLFQEDTFNDVFKVEPVDQISIDASRKHSDLQKLPQHEGIADADTNKSSSLFGVKKPEGIEEYTHEAKRTDNDSVILNVTEETTDVLKCNSGKNIVCLKPPIGSFYESDVNMNFSKSFLPTLSQQSVLSYNNKLRLRTDAENEDMEPIKKALNSLRTRVDAIRAQVIDVASNKCIVRPRSAPTRPISIIKYPDFSRKKNFVNESFAPKLLCEGHTTSSFSTNTYCDSYCSSRHNSTSQMSCSSYESSGKYSDRNCVPPKNIYSHYSRCSSKKSENSKRRKGRQLPMGEPSSIFPDQNLQKCLILLKKNFRDFENSRRKYSNKDKTSEMKPDKKNVNLKAAEESFGFTEKRGSSNDWFRNKNYEVCFKNEKFKNISETSLESRSTMTITEMEENCFAPVLKTNY